MKHAFYLFSICCLAAGLSGCASKPAPITAPIVSASNEASTKTDTPIMTPTGMQTSPPLTGINRVINIFKPYKINIQQGNFISKEMIAQLKEGMTPDQIRFVLGTPLLADVFHADRWDYTFRVQRNTGEITTSQVTVYFKDGKMERFTGNELPTEQDFIAQLAGAPPAAKTKKAQTSTEAKPEAVPEAKEADPKP